MASNYFLNISSVTKKEKGKEKFDKKIVMYEEIAEHYQLSINNNELKGPKLVNQHVRNVLVLSLYFDQIIITSASLFHSKDAFTQNVIYSFLNEQIIKDMLELGVIVISGWGGVSYQSMYDSAADYAKYQVCIDNIPENNLNIIKQHFFEGFVKSRASDMPDLELPEKYKSILRETRLISNEYQHDLMKIEKIIEEEQKQTNSLTSINFLDELSKSGVSKTAHNICKSSLFDLSLSHSTEQIQGAYIYEPLSKNINFERQALSETYVSTNNLDQPLAFLLSPDIFLHFLDKTVGGTVFNNMYNSQYKLLYNTRDESWRQFMNAYHLAVIEISKEVSILLTDTQFLESIDNQRQYWGNKINTELSMEKLNIDSASFIQGIVGITSAVLSIPMPKGLDKLLSSFFKSSKLQITKSQKENRIQTSNFLTILKKTFS